MEPTQFLRRDAAADYLKTKYGFGASRTLAKGVVTGDGPQYCKAGRIVLYRREDLDAWGAGKDRGATTIVIRCEGAVNAHPARARSAA
jgi:hypothetical protein